VYRICRRLVGPASADDAFQATFLVLACRAGSVRKAGSVGSWLVGVAGRVARQLRRRESGSNRQAELPPMLCSLPPDSCLLASELAAVLDDELTRLSDDLRAPVVLCLMHGRTQEEAAAELGGSVRTVRRRLDRAKAVLRARLERRGVVPVVAAGLVAGAGGPAGAVPAGLERRAVNGVFEFLAGGPITPVAAVAKGVVGSMVQLKVSVAVVSAAVVLIGFGVGWADEPKPEPAFPLPPLRTELPPAPPADQPGSPAVPPPLPPRVAAPVQGESEAAYRSTNFLVAAPSPVQARMLAFEAEHLRREFALKWLGAELPKWNDQPLIRFRHDPGAYGGSTTFTFGGLPDKPILVRAQTQLTGSFLIVAETVLPKEVTHMVLAAHFGKPVPRWADEGIAELAWPNGEAVLDNRMRDSLNAGRGIRLRTLFRMTEYPRDVAVLYAQGHSVVRFLLARADAVPVLSDVPLLNQFYKNVRTDGRQRLLAFVRLGMDGNREATWNEAAKEVYGFDSVDKLEEAWLDWLHKPESKPGAKPAVTPVIPPVPKPAPKPVEPELIPPLKLPGSTPRPSVPYSRLPDGSR
jgi:RNA polymerase sigma factor (sigma-70 family)